MIKAKLGNGGILLGLSNENIKRLKRGMPIKINLSELGLEPRELYIVHGKTEKDIMKDLRNGKSVH